MDIIEMVYWTDKFREAALDSDTEVLDRKMMEAWYASWEMRLKIQAGAA